ncbi:ATP-binding protein [Sphingobacterium spiritivorum]|uniref:ATP-binding protein n=1 Tax=Sphingobacterium spiritivorum TaxID=258 RepID=UPI003DA60FFD
MLNLFGKYNFRSRKISVENKQLAILSICLIASGLSNIIFNLNIVFPIGINLLIVTVISLHLYILKLALQNKATERIKFWYFCYLTGCLAVIWALNNGLDSSIPLFFVFYLMAGLLSLSDPYRLRFGIFFLIVSLFCLIIDHFFPQFIVPYANQKEKHMDMLFSFVLTLVISTIMISSYKRVYEYEKKVLILQKKMLKLSQKELIASKELAEAATKAKSKFIMTMSHEIRTPLNGIIGTIDLLKTTKLDQNQQLLIENLQASSHILSDLVTDLLDISRIETNKFEINYTSFNLNQSLNSLKHVIDPMLKSKDLMLNIWIAENTPAELITDEARFKQILLNLLSNAIKFTLKGNITVYISYILLHDKYVLECKVKDTGIGIKKENIFRLFDQFSQIEEPQIPDNKGIGLGLAICQRLLHILGGHIEVESVYGVGTTFTFRLPVLLPKNQIPQKIYQPNPDLSFMEKKRFLIVEDNKINQLVLCKMLEKLQYSYHAVENGLEAVEKVQKEHFDIILMDIQMPVMNGIEATKMILELYNQRQEEAPVIIGCSAHALEIDRSNYLQIGMSDFIIKPVTMDHLKDVIKKNSI